MLSHLSIKNLAIIESLEFDLNENMTVLTGETGAGKSIIIDAISLLMGDRASSEMIRHDEEVAIIEGVFEVTHNTALKSMLKHLDIEAEDQLIIKRTLKRAGGGQVRVNGELVSINQLKVIGNYLVDIHVQHDTHRLFQTEHNYELIDNFDLSGHTNMMSQEYLQQLGNYQSTRQKYNDFKKNADEISKRIDLILFQREEIEKAHLKIGEYEQLEERRQIILNSDKLHKTYTQVIHALNGDGGVIETLYEAMTGTQYIATLDDTMNVTSTQVSDYYYGLEEVLSNMNAKLDELNYSPEELEEIEMRLNELQAIKRKYRMEIDELLDYYAKISEELTSVEDSEQYEQGLINDILAAYNELITSGEALNESRLKLAKQIENELVSELKDLQLNNTQFEIEFNKMELSDPLKDTFISHGLYDIQFMLSTNKGEPMKPLHKIASGGELSRLMLALKTILNRGQSISTIIFDEIDTGVSGQVASSIGSKMKEIARHKQVLCITHLPQVASLANHHIHVTKNEKNNRTVTSLSYLTIEERTTEIARMLSGDNITLQALENARQLLQ
ncbi:MAG TPA: DNA repair protein RecN [Firmicutes bacterium]|nr:DNA repair protein RecN [Bacillota bacterium]